MDQATELRNIVKYNNQGTKKVARVITVTSGKGGVGKSNVAINLAVEFTRLGQKVIIFDADFGLANIEVMFGAIPKHNLADVIYKGTSIAEVVTQGPMDIGFISGGCGIAQLSQLSMQQVGVLVNSIVTLDTMADIVIIDTGAGISGTVLEFLVASNEVLLVTTPEPTSITDSYSLLKSLSRHERFDAQNTVIKMIANRVDDTPEGQQLYQKLNAVVRTYLKLDLGFLGVVPNDQQLARAVMVQSPVCIQNPNARSSRAFASLAGVLMNKEDSQTTFRRGMSGFLMSFARGRR
ncbi:MAG: MinD/ParA family protein [Lachnospiraceae bacterium]|nr:MinD/ParA family protein [Lachnospiraceae bacterium]